MGNAPSTRTTARSPQGWSSNTEDFSSTSIDSETFPCTIGSNNDSLHFSLQDAGPDSRKSGNNVALQVKSKDKNGVLWSSFANSGWKIVGSLDKVGSKAVLTDSGGHTLALVLKRNKKSFLFLSKQPAYRGQRMHLRLERGTMLYPWATTEEKTPLQFLIKRYDNLGITYLVDLSTQIFGVRTIQIMDAATEQRYAIIRQQQVHAESSPAGRPNAGCAWTVVSGPSVSPGMVMCIVAIINKDDTSKTPPCISTPEKPSSYAVLPAVAETTKSEEKFEPPTSTAGDLKGGGRGAGHTH
jgi:hypothetical protein